MNVCKDDASILIIYTGGTIGMIENPETGSLEAFNFEHLEEHVPELKNLGYKISSIQFDPPMDSSEMGPDSWMKIVHVIAEHYHDYDGFVVLHGTDTMAFTASALSFMLENLSKPVVLTGSQLPIGMQRNTEYRHVENSNNINNQHIGQTNITVFYVHLSTQINK